MARKLLKPVLVGVVSCAILFFIQYIYSSPWAKTPFANLDADDVLSVNVIALAPSIVTPVTDRESIEQVVDVLRSVETYKKVLRDDIYYSEGAVPSDIYVTLTLLMKDGSKTVVWVPVIALKPILRINNQSYESTQEPCAELIRIANELGETLDKTG
jgi:hypothetical protein